MILSGLIILVAGLHIVAMRYNLYFSVWWLDLPVHFLGGAWAGLFGIFYYQIIKKSPLLGPKSIWRVGCITAIFLGVFWELYEYSAGLIFTTKGSYGLDTTLDLLMDTFGGITASAMSARKRFLL